jgi:hypothetical protein
MLYYLDRAKKAPVLFLLIVSGLLVKAQRRDFIFED